MPQRQKEENLVSIPSNPGLENNEEKMILVSPLPFTGESGGGGGEVLQKYHLQL